MYRYSNNQNQIETNSYETLEVGISNIFQNNSNTHVNPEDLKKIEEEEDMKRYYITREITFTGNKRAHTRKDDPDNMLSKNNVHSIIYSIASLNKNLEKFGFVEKFLNIRHKSKKLSNYQDFSQMKNLTLKDIICQEISSQYKNYDSNHNLLLCEKIQNENEVIQNLLGTNYFSFIKNYYLKNKKIINLKDFGSKEDSFIDLTRSKKKILTHQDLLQSFRDKDEDEEYVKLYDETIKECYGLKKVSFIVERI